MDSKLKVIIDFLIKDAVDAGTDEFILNIPSDYKPLLYQELSYVAQYMNSRGYSISTNQPGDGSWRGWDIVPLRQSAFPEEYAVGRSHSNYQLMSATPENITVKATLIRTVTPQ